MLHGLSYITFYCGLCCCKAQVLPLPGLLMCSLHKHINVLRVFILLLCTSVTLPKPLADIQPTQQPRCQAHVNSPFPASFWLVKTIKTGGTTLAGVLRQICAHTGVVPVNKRSINPLEQLPDAEAAAALRDVIAAAKNATDAAEFAIITHLNYSDAKLAAFQSALGGRRPLLLTSARHPLGRTYSHFIQAKCANAAAMLGGKIIECDRNVTYMNKLLELDNIRNRWSFVKVPSRHNLVYNYIRGNTTTAEAALAPYDFVFISERMDEGEQCYCYMGGGVWWLCYCGQYVTWQAGCLNSQGQGLTPHATSCIAQQFTVHTHFMFRSQHIMSSICCILRRPRRPFGQTACQRLHSATALLLHCPSCCSTRHIHA